MQGAQIGRLGRTNFGIRLNTPEKRAAKDFNNNLIVLYARSEEECNVWVSTLRSASRRKLEDYYEVMEIIGEGGFAKVRLGRCLTTNKKRAIKTMDKAEAHAKVLGTEVAIIKRVDHPNIVKTFDVFESSEQIHIVMEYMEGGMLYDSIEDGVQFDEADVVQFMRELLDGVLYLHEMGIVHRDIKPENVLCTSKQTPLHVKIADFGLSSISTVADMKENRMLMSTMIGTPEFVAPEIARQETYTEKVDMWALGMLCYNVIARRLPLDEDRDMITQIQQGITLTFPEPEWEQYSEHARSFVRSLLCPKYEKRLSPLGCLVHRWVETIAPEQSTKFAAHGRMSNILFAPNAKTRMVMEKHHDLNVKLQWKKLYLAINAMCKLTNCCGTLKMFGTAKLRALTMVVNRGNGIEYADSNDMSCSDLSMQLRLVSTATSNSTLMGDNEGKKYDFDYRHHHQIRGSVSESYRGASAARMAREISKFDTIQGKPNGVGELSNSQYNLGKNVPKSGDMDLAFDDLDIVDDNIDIPKSLNSNDGVLTAGMESSSRSMLRFPAFGKKGQKQTNANMGCAIGAGASVGENAGGGNDGLRTDATEMRTVRKLIGKTVRGVRDSTVGKGNCDQNKNSQMVNHGADVYDPKLDEEGGSSFATSSAVLSTPCHPPGQMIGNGGSSCNGGAGSKADSSNGNGDNDHVSHSPSGMMNKMSRLSSKLGGASSKQSLRKRILQTLSKRSSEATRDGYRTEAGDVPSRKQKTGQIAMNKLSRMLRGKGGGLNHGDNSPRSNRNAPSTIWKPYQDVSNQDRRKQGLTDSHSLAGIHFPTDFDQDDEGRRYGEREDKFLVDDGVRTFDAAHLQHMYSNMEGVHQNHCRHDTHRAGSLLPKFLRRENRFGANECAISRTQSGVNTGLNVNTARGTNGNFTLSVIGKKVVGNRREGVKDGGSSGSNEEAMRNRMSPLTPSTEVPKRPGFGK